MYPFLLKRSHYTCFYGEMRKNNTLWSSQFIWSLPIEEIIGILSLSGALLEIIGILNLSGALLEIIGILNLSGALLEIIGILCLPGDLLEIIGIILFIWSLARNHWNTVYLEPC